MIIVVFRSAYAHLDQFHWILATSDQHIYHVTLPTNAWIDGEKSYGSHPQPQSHTLRVEDVDTRNYHNSLVPY